MSGFEGVGVKQNLKELGGGARRWLTPAFEVRFK